MKQLKELQSRVMAPKNLKNGLTGSDYSDVEEMFLNVKSIVSELGCMVVFADEVVNIGKYNYVKATVTITNDDGESVSTHAFAKEDEDRAGMSNPQMSYSASVCARQCALCGLLSVDIGGFSDGLDNRPKEGKNGKGTPAPQIMGTRKIVSKLEYVDDEEEESNPHIQELKEFCRIKVESGLSTEAKALRFYNYYKDKVVYGRIDLNYKWGQWRDNYKPKNK
jgi:hypothetical protein